MTASSPIFGYDVSHWKIVSHTRAKAEGHRFAWAKATEGTSFVDPTYRTQVAGIRAVGLLPGAYHFLRPGNAAAQCGYFLDVIGNPDGLLCALDVEDGTYADVQQWVARWRVRTTHPLFIYSGSWFWKGHLGDPSSRALGCPLWDSNYVRGVGSHATLYSSVARSGFQEWTPTYGGWADKPMLQFSSSATVAGVAKVDVNAWAGTWDELVALSRTTPKPKPTGGALTMADAASIQAKLDQLYEAVIWNRVPGAVPGSSGGDHPSLWGNRAQLNEVNGRLQSLVAQLHDPAQKVDLETVRTDLAALSEVVAGLVATVGQPPA